VSARYRPKYVDDRSRALYFRTSAKLPTPHHKRQLQPSDNLVHELILQQIDSSNTNPAEVLLKLTNDAIIP
jgi:hypothetical protein